jgi:protein SCO1
MLMKRLFYGTLITGLLLSVTACSNQQSAPSDQQKSASNEQPTPGNQMKFVPTASKGQTVQSFQFKDQDGKPFGSNDLKGKVWIADFFFTHCTHVCPRTSPNKIKLEKLFKEKGLDVQLVSFSVDPQNDTPSVLKEYGQQFNDDFSRHHYLTGYDFKEIQDFASKNFNLQLKQMGKDIMHGQSFYLINREGQIQKEYDGLNPNFDEIVQDVKALQ